MAFERNTKIIDGEDVFEQLGVSVVADAAGLACGVQGVSECVGAHVEVVVVGGLIDADTPEDNGGVIPIAANHAANIVDGDLLPRFRTDVLPTRDFFEDE